MYSEAPHPSYAGAEKISKEESPLLITTLFGVYETGLAA